MTGRGSSAPVLRLEHVTRTFGSGVTTVLAIDDINLTVSRGELVAVMGPSGSGKSTLLNICGALDVPDVGTVTIDGTNLSGLSSAGRARLRRRRLGYVFQDFNLIPSLTAMENVSLPLELDHAPRAQAREQARDALEDLGVLDLADRFPDDMSGGQRQRVAIARAVVGTRSLLLADEPTGALDSSTGDAVMSVLRERVDDGAAGVLVTHEARLAAWADRTVFLRDGRVTDATRYESFESLLGPS
jgi:putative ABC transport system ATP-binding protein